MFVCTTLLIDRGSGAMCISILAYLYVCMQRESWVLELYMYVYIVLPLYVRRVCGSRGMCMNVLINLFIYCHLYSALSIVQCSNALYRL